MPRLRPRNPDLHLLVEPSLLHRIPASVTTRLAQVPPDLRVARVAGRQESLITRSQLSQLGVTRGAIERRRSDGRLHRVHREVFLAGPPPLTPRGRLVAALLACGPAAAVSHTSALWLWGLAPLEGPVHVTLPGRCRARHQGIVAHTSERLGRADVRALRGLPVTAPALTLVDVAAGKTQRVLRRLADEMVAGKLLIWESLADTVERHPRRRGIAGARSLLAEGPAATRSEAERRLLELVRAADLPRPLVNERIAGFEVDVHWPEARTIVEVDGFAFHGTRAAFERDRRRDAELQAQGWRVVRLTWRRVVDEPEVVIAQLRRLVETSARLRDGA